MTNIKNISFKKSASLIKDFPSICEISYKSYEYIERELTRNHLVVILQNQNSNMYSDKVTVVPIEGDWNKIKPSYQTKLTNENLYSGKLNKDPSRIIFADIMTIDKSRLGRKIGILKDEKFKNK